MRPAPLREGHGARVEPAVDDLRHAPHPPAGSERRVVGDGVDVGLVHPEIVREAGVGGLGLREHVNALHAGLAKERGVRGHRLGPARRLAHPDRQRCAPVPLAGEGPVDVGLKEVAEAAALDVLREPLDPVVVGQHLVAELTRADEPALPRILDQGIGVGPPTEGVVVHVLLLMNEQPTGPQVAGDVAVAVLHEPPAPHPKGIGERAVGGDGVEQPWASARREPGLLGEEDGVVDLAEGRRDVNDARAAVGGHEVGRDDPPGGGLRAAGGERSPLQRPGGSVGIEGGEVGAANEGGARKPLERFKLLLELLAEARGEWCGDDVFRRLGDAGFPDHHVLQIGFHGSKLVRGERPGGGRPGDEAAGGRRAGVIEQRKRHVHARVGDLLVALPNLAAGKSRAPLRPPPDDLVPLVEQPAVEEIGQRPPDALHVRLVVGDVGLREIDPEADPLGERLPLLHVPPDALLALVDEGLHAIGLNLRLGVDSEFLADFDLDGQTMRVPARLPLAVLPPHRPVPGVEVFDRAGQAVARVWHPVGGGRPLEEHEPRCPSALIERLSVGVVLPPQAGDRRLEGGKVGLAADRVEHGGVTRGAGRESRPGSLPSYRGRRRRHRAATSGQARPRTPAAWRPPHRGPAVSPKTPAAGGPIPGRSTPPGPRVRRGPAGRCRPGRPSSRSRTRRRAA